MFILEGTSRVRTRTSTSPITRLAAPVEISLIVILTLQIPIPAREVAKRARKSREGSRGRVRADLEAGPEKLSRKSLKNKTNLRKNRKKWNLYRKGTKKYTNKSL